MDARDPRRMLQFKALKAKGGKYNLALLIEGDIAFTNTQPAANSVYFTDPNIAPDVLEDRFQAHFLPVGYFCYADGCDRRHGWDGCILKMCSKCQNVKYCSVPCQKLSVFCILSRSPPSSLGSWSCYRLLTGTDTLDFYRDWKRHKPICKKRTE